MHSEPCRHAMAHVCLSNKAKMTINKATNTAIIVADTAHHVSLPLAYNSSCQLTTVKRSGYDDRSYCMICAC